MKSKLLLGAALVSLPVIAGGLAIASVQRPGDEQKHQSVEKGFICPATGETLECEHCCPLSK